MLDDVKKHWLLVAILAVAAVIALDLWQTTTNLTGTAKAFLKMLVSFAVFIFALMLASETVIMVTFLFVALSIWNHLFSWIAAMGASSNYDWIQSVEDTISGGSSAQSTTPTIAPLGTNTGT